MADSTEKKDTAKKKAKKRQEKAEKMEQRKANNNKGKNLEDMMAYIDADGNITTTPPDQQVKREVNVDEILLGAAPRPANDAEITGVVSFFNTTKGYGFIVGDVTGQQFFFHNSNLLQPVQDKDRVMFKTEQTAKGVTAIQVKKISK